MHSTYYYTLLIRKYCNSRFLDSWIKLFLNKKFYYKRNSSVYSKYLLLKYFPITIKCSIIKCSIIILSFINTNV